MNIFQLYTKRSLHRNAARTWVTVIGIALSMALLTAVVEAANSGVVFLRNAEAETSGNYHAILRDMDNAFNESLKASDEVASYARTRIIGWAEFNSRNADRPYLLLKSFSEELTGQLSICLTEGRYPEKEGEIILPQTLADPYNGGLSWKTGQKIGLSVGKRMSEGESLSTSDFYREQEESLQDTVYRTYTVVGFFRRLTHGVEPFECPGYSVFCYDGAVSQAADASFDYYLQLKKPQRFFDSELLQQYGENIVVHDALLRYYGALRNDNLMSVFYGMVIFLVALILFGSIALITNAFQISVSERIRQIGILKSVGATNRQIRSMVLYEALMLDILAIPLGALIGCVGIRLTLYALRDAFALFLNEDAATTMQFVFNVPGLLLSAALCLLTTVLSALIPAKHAIRIPPIAAIRENTEIKISARETKISRLSQKLFGFEGTMAIRNFKRSRRRYASTVFSLAFSVVLFLSASSFCTYLTDSVTGVAGTRSEEDIYCEVFGYEMTEGQTPESIYNVLSELDGVQQIVLSQDSSLELAFDREAATDDFLKLMDQYGEESGQKLMLSMPLTFIDNAAFDALCRENSVNLPNQGGPYAVIINSLTAVTEENGANVWHSCQVLRPNQLPVRFDNEGYSFSVIAAVEKPFYLQGGRPYIILPLSAAGSILNAEQQEEYRLLNNYYFKTDDHKALTRTIQEALSNQNLFESLVVDQAGDLESTKMLIFAVRVFAYGFIILISLVALANVFNTISTNIALRKRELAMLQSVGLSRKGLKKMLAGECLIYGVRSLLFGIPVSILLTYVIFRITARAFRQSFYLPLVNLLIAVVGVFVIVFATMFYAVRKAEKNQLAEVLKLE